MPKRNKKRRKSDGFVFPIPFALFVTVVSVLALSYLWLDCRKESLGREIKALENERVAIQKRFFNEEYKWTKMKSPQNIEWALRRCNLDMTWPRRDQIVRLDAVESPDNYLTGADAFKVARLERAMMNE